MFSEDFGVWKRTLAPVLWQASLRLIRVAAAETPAFRHCYHYSATCSECCGTPKNQKLCMAYNETCSCGRVFTTPGAAKNHQNSCTTSKRHLSAALSNAKELFAIQKAKKLQTLVIKRQLQVDDRTPNFVPGAPGQNSNLAFDLVCVSLASNCSTL